MRVPAWLLMLVAGILFGPNASLIILVGGGEWPLLYGAVGSFGMGCMFGLGAVGLGWSQGIGWMFLKGRGTVWRSFPLIMLSRASYPLYVLSGAYIHYVVAGMMTALLPAGQTVSNWLLRLEVDLQGRAGG